VERVASLDLLRGIAALSVAIPHFIMLSTSSSGPAESVSVLAVEVFFVLSGFVLGPQILHCLHTGRAGDLRIFLVRRWMRTIPPYLFALALISTIVGHVRPADLTRYVFYVENLLAQHNVDDYFPVAWSLSIEEWFYVAFPGLLMIAAWGFRSDRDRFAVLTALCFIGAVTVLRLLFGDLDDWGSSVRRVVLFRLDSIAYGFLLYMSIRHSTSRTPRTNSPLFSLPAASLLFGAAATIVGVATWRIEAARSHIAETLFPFAAAAFGMSAILLAYAARGVFQGRRLAEVCYFLGRVSYSLYLFHLCVAMTVAPQLAALPAAVQLTVYLGTCIALSAVFYRVFERPILAMRPDYPRPLENTSSFRHIA
jgi:peptidoglycan/LPS O-acetylase OafA/YrhL